MLQFIDTHTHNTDEAFEGCADELIGRALEAGVVKMLLPDIDSKERDAMFAYARRHADVCHPMLGLYPGSVDGDWREEIDRLCAYDRTGVVAVGEIGLDYHYGTEFKKEQQEALRVQLELASQWDLPVNIHLREATGDFLDIVRDCRHLHLRGNLHAFSGSAETFAQLSRLGDWYVAIGGVITFKNAAIAREVRDIPLSRILLETDAPYLAPVPYRGKRNESSLIPVIAGFLARCKGCSLEDVSDQTCRNARQLFKI